MINAAGRGLVVFVILCSGLGCRLGGRNPGRGVPEPQVEHVVVFWLKQPGNGDARRRIIHASEAFRAIRGVLRVDAGPMLPSPRGNVDRTFDVAVVMLFENRQALEDYQSHPRHAAMLAELGPLVERTVAYDFAPQRDRN